MLKSIGAGFAGIFVGVVLSLGTDALLERFGVLPHGNLWVSASLIWFVLFYRTLYNIVGSYIVARLAPRNPMRHVIFVGILGTLVSIVGAVATRDMNLGPLWYPWTLALLTLPSSWLGGKWYIRGSK
jgi:Na+/serine symporter